MQQEIALGCEAKDLTTGLKGIITSRVVLMNGNLRFILQPPCAPGADKMPDGYEIDAQSLEYVSQGIMKSGIPCPADTGIELGNEYEDIVSGTVGIAIARYDSMNGCVRYVIQGKTKKDAKEPNVVYVDYSQLKPTGKNSVMTHLKKAIEKAKKLSSKAEADSMPKAARRVSTATPGGPTTKAPRF